MGGGDGGRFTPGWRSLGEDGGGGCPQKHLWTNHSLSTSSLPSVMYLQSVHLSAASSAAPSSSPGQWRPKQHLLEGWGQHPTTNSSSPGQWRPKQHLLEGWGQHPTTNSSSPGQWRPKQH